MSYKAGIVAVVALVAFHSSAVAGALKPQTRTAWDEYLQAANTSMEARLQPGAKFLWLDEDPKRAEALRKAGAYISPMTRDIPRKVPSGLIHHWIGVSFVPNVKIETIIRMLRDYDHYKDVYRPGVIESASHGSEGSQDLFSLRLISKTVIAKTALDTECEARYFRVDDRRWYGVSNSLHIHEVDKFGTPQQRTLPEDEGLGLIWRLSSITRLEERDGGVYTELEAIALSRDIPAALRVFVTPVVRRVSRDSMATSLRQTRVAVSAVSSAE